MSFCLNFKQNHEVMFGNILSEDVRFPSRMSQEARDLLTGLLVKDPSRRLGGGRNDARDIMQHVFFASIDWDLLVQKKVIYSITSISSSVPLPFFFSYFL